MRLARPDVHLAGALSPRLWFATHCSIAITIWHFHLSFASARFRDARAGFEADSSEISPAKHAKRRERKNESVSEVLGRLESRRVISLFAVDPGRFSTMRNSFDNLINCFLFRSTIIERFFLSFFLKERMNDLFLRKRFAGRAERG